MKQLFKTHNDWTGLVTRLSIGLILFPHGAQKMLGLFGGQGFSGTVQGFTEGMHLPWIIAFLVIIIEFFGSISLILGFAGRFWAFCVVVLMLGIVFTVHIHNGFFMNWHGDKKGEGFEYHLLMIGLALATMINGSGKFAIDGAINRNNSLA
jgi:putative oxidoreductase